MFITLLISGCFFLLIGFCLSFFGIEGQPNESLESISIIFFILGGLIILYAIKIRNTRKANIARGNELKKTIEAEKQKLKSQGMVSEVVLRHISGLGTAANVFCTIQVWQERYTFIMNNITFNLQRDKVTDIAIKTETYCC